MSDIFKTNRFHGIADHSLFFRLPSLPPTTTTQSRYFIIQERDVSYRINLHQHPFVRQLSRRLIQNGVPVLQGADTEDNPDGGYLPGSIGISLNNNTEIVIPPNSRIALLSDLQASSGGVPLILSGNMALDTAGSAQITLADEAKAMLVDGMVDIHAATSGDTFSLGSNTKAVLVGDTKISFVMDAQIMLDNGTQAAIPAGTQVILVNSSELNISAGTSAKLLKSKPLPLLFDQIFSSQKYDPSALVEQPFPVKDLDFTFGGPYSIYNWELFFHIPIIVAIHLSKNQRFAESQKWFHYIFDPTDNTDGPTPQRFWKVKPFQTTDIQKLEDTMVNIATGADPNLLDETMRSLDAWKNSPFSPHVIARFRQQAYMYKTVMAYLDNLISWGDSLFRQDTGEAVDEALMLYVLAANILGPRPQPVPKKGSVRPMTYSNLRKDIAQFGIITREVEADPPFDIIMPLPSANNDTTDNLAAVRSLGKALYFCVPRNDNLLRYWDIVADRLFKIRNSLNIQGAFRQLALFEPPIDPALLARAAASGIDVGAIVNGLNQPLPLVRFQLLVQKASEIAQEVKVLGNSLLSTMEKEDGEDLVIIRARHERAILEMVEYVKYDQHQEAIKSSEGLEMTLELAKQRYAYYELLLGKKPEEIVNAIPVLAQLDKVSLEKESFNMAEPAMVPRQPKIDISKSLGESEGTLSSHEDEELSNLNLVLPLQLAAQTLKMTAQLMAPIPGFHIDLHYWGVGMTQIIEPGKSGASVLELLGDAAQISSDILKQEAEITGKTGIYARRAQEWAFQSNLAAGEINQIFKQLRAAQIREAIAEQELKVQRQQIQNAKEIEEFLNADGTATTTGKKTTNKALYAWMKREVKGLYSQCFQLAFEVAKKAERALQHELGNTQLSYLQYGYLAGKEGLLAGEKLYFDIKRMDMAYHDLNQREYELTKHVSLLQLDPMALIQLRMTGKCMIRLPESLFDMDGPGHYFRRIKTVALGVPCVVGPYASVNCTLRLLKSSIRINTSVDDGYARLVGDDDGRFSDYFGSMQSIVTSSGQNDSGLFETSLRDERYLPFENSGVISEWELRLPADPSDSKKSAPVQFDYSTISDVILHIRYTAREGGELLRAKSIETLNELIKDANVAGSVRLFSIRHEFPTEWARFKAQTLSDNMPIELKFTIRQEHYPFWTQGRQKNVTSVDVLARSEEEPIPSSIEIYDKADSTTTKDTLVKDEAFGNLLVGKLDNIKLENIGLPTSPFGGDLKLYVNTNKLSDFWIAIRWNEE
jgi:hypothetical protein